MPKFSVIVPMYNCEKYIEKCIESVLQQTYTDFELIIVDDGSYDSSPKICDKYAQKDDRVKVIHKKNEGVSKARQIGVDIAQGAYVVFVDGDDWIDGACFERFADTIQKYKSDIVCCGAVWSYVDKQIDNPISDSFKYYDRFKIEQNIFPILIESKSGKYFANNIWAKAIKREIYRSSQLKNIYVDIGEDSACIKPCIYQANSIALLKECFYYYRQNELSATKCKRAFEWYGPKNIGVHLENHIPMDKYDFQEQLYRNIVHNLFNVCVSQFNRNEKYKVIKKDILQHLTDTYYQEAIKKCRYEKCAWKNILAKFVLKRKIICLMWIYNQSK